MQGQNCDKDSIACNDENGRGRRKCKDKIATRTQSHAMMRMVGFVGILIARLKFRIVFMNCKDQIARTE